MIDKVWGLPLVSLREHHRMPLNTKILKENLNHNFVETGTWLGEGIQSAHEAGFRCIWSVDIDPNKTVAAQALYKNRADVACFTGDSALFLEDVVGNITSPTTFWLDAHPMGYFRLLQPDLPLVNELLALSWFPRHIEDIILIDDIRLFSDEDNTSLRDFIYKLWPSCVIDYIDSPIVANDILRVKNLL